MSHPVNTTLYDALADMIPPELIDKLKAEGLSEMQILERYSERSHEGKVSGDYPIGGTVEPFDIEREKSL